MQSGREYRPTEGGNREPQCRFSSNRRSSNQCGRVDPGCGQARRAGNARHARDAEHAGNDERLPDDGRWHDAAASAWKREAPAADVGRNDAEDGRDREQVCGAGEIERMANDGAPWYRNAAARSLILRRYLLWLAVLSLGWEIAQLPLYTLWKAATLASMAFAVAHCTVGDILIGSAALAAALVITQAPTLAGWHWRRIAFVSAMIATSYTAFSEWMNTFVLRSWEYSELMPRVSLGDIELGLSPLVQWLLIPPLALWLASRARWTAG